MAVPGFRTFAVGCPNLSAIKLICRLADEEGLHSILPCPRNAADPAVHELTIQHAAPQLRHSRVFTHPPQPVQARAMLSTTVCVSLAAITLQLIRRSVSCEFIVSAECQLQLRIA